MEKYLDFKNNIDETKLEIVGETIANGGLVIFPTETVYGIGTNGLNENAIKNLYSVKKRDLNKPISLLVSNIDMVNQIAYDINDIEYNLMNAFFPGPFTIVLKKKNIISDVLTAGKDTVGVRMPDCEITQKLIEYANCPIAAPSANISGKPSGTTVNDFINDFSDKVDYIIDNGDAKIGVASTIVQVINGVPNILREGSITKEQILKVL